MLSDAPVSLPLTSPPLPQESGTGYCLRVLARNQYNFNWLRRTTGMPERAMITAPYAARIADVLGCEATWLSEALPHSQLHGKRHAWKVYGQRFGIRNHLRSLYPQVCPRCVHHEGYCRKEWDLSITALCVRHRCPLVDHCQKCRGRLRWDRPDLGVCHCGAVLASLMERPADAGVFQILSAVDSLMAGELQTPDFWPREGLPNVLVDLSLDGLITLVHAFGAHAFAHQSGRTSQFTRVARTHEWVDILERGVSRLRWFASGGKATMQELAAHVSQPLLMRLANDDFRAKDAQVGHQIFEALYGKDQARRLRASHSQLELFE